MSLLDLENVFEKEDLSLITFDSKKIDMFLSNLTLLLMFDYRKSKYNTKDKINRLYDDVCVELKTIVDDKQKQVIFLNSLPEIRKSLNTTIEAILEGDPASYSKQQIVLMYPGFEAILNYRIAHLFYTLGYFLISRYISEKAHHDTGIDINPGATIGDYFFIDHGTGIVIGETAIIGNNVKLYQGVTLGALSLSKGRCLKGKKRHPTVEDNVTIYSNAAIFGGDTIIGKGSIIGGDVYLTHSVEENSIVLQTDKNLTILKKNQE
jgi:serine O-acetyltransferase